MRRKALIVGVIVAAYFLPLLLSRIDIRMAIEILYLGLLAVAFNLLLGYVGLLSFGFNATFGIGGYALGVLIAHAPGISLLSASAAAAAISGVVGLAIGAFCVRLQGGYFSLMTLAFCQLLYAGAIKARSITGGEDGIAIRAADIAVPGLSSGRFSHEALLYWIVLTVVLLCLGLMWRFVQSPLGQAAVLIRENGERTSFLGYNVYLTKLIVYTLASTMAGISGMLFALLQGLVSPGTLSLTQAGEPLFMAVLGGTGYFLGPFLGSVVYALFQDWLSRTTEHWQLFMGLIFVALVIFAPDGLLGIAQRIWLAIRSGSTHSRSSESGYKG